VTAAAVGSPALARRARERGYCRTSHKLILQAPRELNRTEFVSLLLIYDSTVGWQRDRAAIAAEQISETANVSAKFVRVCAGVCTTVRMLA
jgi:hypothetical protein